MAMGVLGAKPPERIWKKSTPSTLAKNDSFNFIFAIAETKNLHSFIADFCLSSDN